MSLNDFKFFEEEHIYKITFSSKSDCFIYQPKLSIGNKYLQDIPQEPIQQNIVPLYVKLNIFLEALQKANELNQKEEKLYSDTIGLYEDKKQFSLLITLFLKIYGKNKELCKKLIEIFYRINDQENNDKIDDLKKNLKSFKDIFSNAHDIINENNYNPVYFYGVLFCYLHFYDANNFPKIIEEFFEGNANNLYEILICYYSHFINPLKQSQKFFKSFIDYALKENKGQKIFERIMNYIEDIETYVFVINSYKEKIFKQYQELRSNPLEMDASLKLLKHKEDKITNGEHNNDSDISDEDDDKVLEEVVNIENECHKIVKLIESIINYSDQEKILAIYIRSSFWINLLEQYKFPDWENISNCHNLRELYKKYNNLVNKLYEDDDNNDIKNDINIFFARDQFAIILNNLIKEFLDKNQQHLTNAEKLGCVRKFNPYFSIKENMYESKRETYIFDYVNFSKITPAFNKAFQVFDFETIFKENITGYINKITEKIKDIQTFGNIIKLINEERMEEDNQEGYIGILKEKYRSVIKDNIELIKNDKELKNGIKTIAKFVSKIFLFDKINNDINNDIMTDKKNDKNNAFLKDEIGSLEDNIKSLIYLELITSYNQEEYKDQKEFIYDIYLQYDKISKKEGRDNVIKLVKNLKDNDRNIFIYEKLLKACQFTKDEFFSNHENYKIKLLCLLNEKLKEESKNKLNIIEQSENGNKFAKSLASVLDAVHKELFYGIITKRDLERFLNIKKVLKNITNETCNGKDPNNVSAQKNDESEIDKYAMEKLGLLSLILGEDYVAENKYFEYKANIDNINEKVALLTSTKDSLMIFHRNKYIDDIRKIAEILDKINNSPMSTFKNNETSKSIDDLQQKYRDLCTQIDEVKDFLLFKKIFEKAQGKDQEDIFKNAYTKLISLKGKFRDNPKNIEAIINDKDYENIFKDIKEELGRKDEIKTDEFLKQMKKHFTITDENAIDDIKLLIKSKKYEMIVNSIDYFFRYILNKDLNLPEKMRNLSNQPLTYLKSALEELSKKDYYDYKSNSSYYRIFTSIYKKKEAIDFLLCKIKESPEPKNFKNLNDKLQEKLDPTNRSITIKDISDMIYCLKHVNKLLNKDIPDIIKYLKDLNEEDIKKFESFSKKFVSIIALDKKSEGDSFKEVYDIINEATFLFHLDSEDLKYKINGEDKKISNINELTKFKNKINMQSQNKIEEEKKMKSKIYLN